MLSFETILTDMWKFAKRFWSPCNSPPAGRESGSWLPSFVSRIVLDFVATMFDLPEVGSSRFSWMAEPLSLDKLEAALDQCNNFCPGLDGLRFFLFKALPMEARLCLFHIYNNILATGWYHRVGIGQKLTQL
jgi:hypothetical protein